MEYFSSSSLYVLLCSSSCLKGEDLLPLLHNFFYINFVFVCYICLLYLSVPENQIVSPGADADISAPILP